MGLLTLLLLLPSNSFANNAVFEQTKTSSNTIFVEVKHARLDVDTESYNGAVVNVGLYSSSNVVVSKDTSDACVIYATGTLSCKTVNGGVISSSLGGTAANQILFGGGSNGFQQVSTFTVSGGNVGIGTSNPGVILELHQSGEVMRLSGAGTSSQYMTFNGTGGESFFGTEATSGCSLTTGCTPYSLVLEPASGRKMHFAYSAGTGVAMTVDTNGNIGIGNTSPQSQFEVDGTSVVFYSQGFNTGAAGTVGPGLGLYSSNSNSNSRNWIMQNGFDNFGQYEICHSAAKGGEALTGGCAFTIDKGGNVGIGTTVAATLFDVEGGSGTISGQLNLGYELDTNSCNAVTTCTVSCSAHKQPLGGGCNSTQALYESAPSGNGWLCTDSLGLTANITAYVICARLQ